MAEVFQNFLQGYTVGDQQGQERRRQNALRQAGDLYGRGHAEDATNALMSAGEFEGANYLATMGRQRREDTARRRIAEAGRGATDPLQRQQAMASAAYENEMPELGAQFDEHWSSLDQNARARSLQNTQIIASVAGSLSGVPVEQRAQAALQAATAAGIPQAEAQAYIAQIPDWSDAAVNALQSRALSAAEQIEQRWRAERAQVEDNQANRAFGLQQRQVALAERTSGPETQRPLPPQALANARGAMAAAGGLRQSYNEFVDRLRNASPQALAGVGPEGAALQSAHRLLAIQAKSPAALDLGALVGADFNILNDILGEPGNIRQLLQQGGREGAIQRLAPFDTFLDRGVTRLQDQYRPWAGQLSQFYPDTSAAGADATLQAPASRGERQRGNLGRANPLPDPSRYTPGSEIRDTETNQRYRVVNGAWQRIGFNAPTDETADDFLYPNGTPL